MYQYDPYTGDQIQPQQGTGVVRSILTSPYTYMAPYMWPTDKGFYSPVGNKKKWSKHMNNIFTQKSGPVQPGKFLSPAFNPKAIPGALKDLSPLGNNKFWSISKLKNRQERMINLQKVYHKKSLGLIDEWYLKGTSTPTKPKGRAAKDSARRWNAIDSEIDEIKERKLQLSQNIKSGKGKIFRLSALKYVGRGIGIVSASLLAYDIASMVAKPLAQAAIGTLNNLATEYQNRFMPEMGGQLALSYLSQGAYTERQRAIQSISRSSLNARSALGQEANYM